MKYELTRAEEQVMQILWEMERAFVKDMIEKFPNPKPAYNTVSTIIRILEKKHFVDHKAYGRTFEYYPVVSKNDYLLSSTNHLTQNYFNGSAKQLLSFFVREKNISVAELEKIMNEISEK